MRDATRIKELADEALASFMPNTGRPDTLLLDKNLREISRIAEDMDARTGRKDPTWWQKVQSRFR